MLSFAWLGNAQECNRDATDSAGWIIPKDIITKTCQCFDDSACDDAMSRDACFGHALDEDAWLHAYQYNVG
jgi:hypothetical protein